MSNDDDTQYSYSDTQNLENNLQGLLQQYYSLQKQLNDITTSSTNTTNINSKNKNVFVNSVDDSATSTFLGGYQYQSTNLVNNGSQTFSRETCKKSAVNGGYKYFSLEQFDKTTNLSTCAIFNDISGDKISSGCTLNKSDNNYYGNNSTFALYETPQPPYAGTYTDNPSNHTMTAAPGTFTNSSNISINTNNFSNCYQYASSIYAKYFGLQNGNPTTGNATCYISNDWDSITQYGSPNTPTPHSYSPDEIIDSNNNILGGVNENAVYIDSINESSPNYLGCYNVDDSITLNSSTSIVPAPLPLGVKQTLISTPITSYNSIENISSLTGFSDDTANVLWNTPNFIINNDLTVPGDSVLIFTYTFNNSTTNTIAGIINTVAINYVQVFVNGIYVGFSNSWPTGPVTNINVTYIPGDNLIQCNVLTLNPPYEGFVLTSKNANTNSLLFNTASSGWNCYLPDNAGYSVNTCSKYANDNKYSFFGLINSPNISSAFGQTTSATQNFTSSQNTNMCYVGNNLSTFNSKGSNDGLLLIGKDYYGISNTGDGTTSTAAVYSADTSKEANNKLLNNIGYVDKDNNVSNYPDYMIKPSSNYNKVNNLISNGNDISKLQTNSSEECLTNCNKTTGCYGAVYENETKTCNLKTKGINGNINAYYKQGTDTYYNIPTIQSNSSSCPTNISPIDSVTWSKYTSTGVPMSSTTTCGFSNDTEPIIIQLTDLGKKIMIIVKILVERTKKNQNNNDDTIINIGINHKKINENIEKYNNIITEFQKYDENQPNINNMLNDTTLKLTSYTYNYNFWLIIALILIIIVIILFFM
jgi:hypothetical protein